MLINKRLNSKYVVNYMNEFLSDEKTSIDKNRFKLDIEDWLKNFVEVPNSSLNGWSPCPYAKEARVSNVIQYHYVKPDEYLVKVLESVNTFDASCKVVLIGTDPAGVKPSSIRDFKDEYKDILLDKDLWVLFDHPCVEENVNGVSFNNGKYVLALIQSLSKLNNAAKKLRKDGYYDSWDKKYFELLSHSRPDFPS